MKKNAKINLNINKDQNELNDFLISWNNFGKRPNKISIQNTYLTSSVTELIDSLSSEKEVFTEIVSSKEGKMIFNQEIFCKINDGIYVSYFIIDKNQPHSIVSDVTFFYKDSSNYEEVKEIIESMNSCLINFEQEDGYNLNLVTIQNGVLDLEPILFEDEFEDVELYYSKETFKNINKCIKSLKKNHKGLYIFNGERGTGKTDIIKYISSNLNKMVIYIPNNIIDSTINNPDFKNILKRYDSPVIVVDDCEVSLQDVFMKSTQASNNIIQMVDGLYSDNNPVSVICIFNDYVEDCAILDCNNLISVIDFEYLDVEEANELCKLVGSKKVSKNKTRMLDIIKRKNSSKEKKIGF
jgi:hypothetical protein